MRGAPAIGVSAAYGLALAAARGDDLTEAAAILRASRPTAVNLGWAIDRMLAVAEERRQPAGRSAACLSCPRKLSPR